MCCTYQGLNHGHKPSFGEKVNAKEENQRPRPCCGEHNEELPGLDDINKQMYHACVWGVWGTQQQKRRTQWLCCTALKLRPRSRKPWDTGATHSSLFVAKGDKKDRKGEQQNEIRKNGRERGRRRGRGRGRGAERKEITREGGRGRERGRGRGRGSVVRVPGW